MLEQYPAQLKEFSKVIPKNEKIDRDKWSKDVDALFDKRMDIEELLNKEIGELACVEVIDYNRANEQRERTNDGHQKTRQKERERVPSRKHSSLER